MNITCPQIAHGQEYGSVNNSKEKQGNANK
jgi:hypothetical protein